MIIETLRKKGYKATTQRITICRFALHSPDHPSAQRVYAEVRRVLPTVSLATVYKTLKILAEHGLVQELDSPESQARFDSYVEPHINLVCMRCGNTQDFDDNAAREIVESDGKSRIHSDGATVGYLWRLQDLPQQKQIAPGRARKSSRFTYPEKTPSFGEPEKST